MTVLADALDLARWQFGMTTLYHFIFVPLTLGLAPLLAVMQTLWYRTRDEKWLRLTRFFGTLFLINFAIGVATGLVMEFQFGMNWSAFSAYIGDIFGSPLAIEGLGAFMLEATFIGLWVFGRDRLSPKVHLVTIYLVWIGTWLSAFFILTANSWMQHPVGYEINSQTGRAEANDIFDILFQKFVWFAWGHVLLAGLLTGGFLVLGVSCWHLLAAEERRALPQGGDARDHRRPASVSGVQLIVGSDFGVARHRRPADEDRRHRGALGHRAARLVLALPDRRLHGGRPDAVVLGRYPRPALVPCHELVPAARSSVSTSSRRRPSNSTGPGNYIPDVRLVYWSMRAMAYLGTLSLLPRDLGRLGAVAQAPRRREVVPAGRARGDRVPVPLELRGLAAHEAGRQPWVVYGLLRTEDAVSSTVSAWTVGLSLGAFALMYTILGVVDLWLMRRYARVDPPPIGSEGEEGAPVPAPGYCMGLEITWFCLICVLWTGYFVLEGFDFGVGMLLPFVGKSQADRGTMLEIDRARLGRERGLARHRRGRNLRRVPGVVRDDVLGLLPRAASHPRVPDRVVSFEWREKAESPRWKAVWTWVNTIASIGAPLLWGIALASLLHGVPIGSTRTSPVTSAICSAATRFSAGIAVVLLFAAHGAVFLRLRMTGDLYTRARRAAARSHTCGGGRRHRVPRLDLVVANDRNDKGVFPGILPVVVAAISALAAIWAVRAARDRLAFVATTTTIAAVVVTLFVSLYPRVMVSNPDFANSLTIDNASSADYTLKVMTVVAAVLIPVILLYQAWTYRVFRARITGAPVGSPADLLGRKPGE